MIQSDIQYLSQTEGTKETEETGKESRQTGERQENSEDNQTDGESDELIGRCWKIVVLCSSLKFGTKSWCTDKKTKEQLKNLSWR